jgi:hypothetical protein
MRKAIVLLAVGVALAFAGTASAGCWATVGVSPLPSAGQEQTTWKPQIQVLQHGRTPMADAKPTVIIENAQTGDRRTFDAALVNGSEGVYQASVVFPEPGTWSVAVNDGFPAEECAATHAFGNFAIGAPVPPAEPPAVPDPQPAVPVTPASAESGGSSLALPLGLGLGLGIAALGLVGAFALRARHGRAARAA